MANDKQAMNESLKDHFTRSALEIWQMQEHYDVPAGRQRAALATAYTNLTGGEPSHAESRPVELGEDLVTYIYRCWDCGSIVTTWQSVDRLDCTNHDGCPVSEGWTTTGDAEVTSGGDE